MIRERVNLLRFFEGRLDRLGEKHTDDAGNTYYEVPHTVLDSLFSNSNGSISYKKGGMFRFYYPLGTFYAQIVINNNFHHKIS